MLELAMLTWLRVERSPVVGLLAGMALAVVLVTIAPPLDAALVVALAAISLRGKLAHQEPGVTPYVLLGMGAVTTVGIAVVLAQ